MFLVIDNYDSFTYNLVHYLGELSNDHPITNEIIVKRNDEIQINEIKKINPKAILLYPGTGNTDKSGICLEIIKEINYHYLIQIILKVHMEMIIKYFMMIVK